MFDTILKNGQVIDGSGNPWFRADVALRDGKIAAVGKLSRERADRVRDVGGLVIAPGFVDTHSHTDWSILRNRKAFRSVQQGITTEVVGNCGMSPFPVTDKNRKTIQMQMADLFDVDLDQITVNWSDWAGFRERVEQGGLSVNLVCFVGHSNVRSAVMGEEGEGGERADPAPAELDEMRRLVDEAMQQGCWGLTTGLVYKPGRNAKTEEVIELARVAARHGGAYMSHLRGYRTLAGLEEFLDILDKADIRGVLSHYSARFYARQKELVGPTPAEQFALINQARAKGAEIYMDILPFGGYSSSSMHSLLLEIEDKFDEHGKRLTLERFKEMLQNPATRQEIEDRARARNEMGRKMTDEANQVKRDFGDMLIVNRSIRFPHYVEHSLSEIAEARGTDLITTAVDLFLEDEGNTLWGSWHCEGDLKQLLSFPAAMVGTDGAAEARNPPLISLADFMTPAVRLFSAFPKVLGVYVREDHLFPLEEAIRKMTSLPAQAMGIKDRGLIREGMWGDLCVFDPGRIAHRATYFEPRQHCVGIRHVLVNGQFAMGEGRLTEALGGKILAHLEG